MRLFFALWPEATARSAIADAARHWLADCKASLTPAGRLHFTLVFLGELPAERLDEVYVAADTVRAQSFALRLERLEFRARREMAWLVPHDAAPARALAEIVRAALVRARIPFDAKPFLAHLTVARRIEGVVRDMALAPIDLRFDSFALVESTLGPTGPDYRTRRVWTLDSAAA